jgi:hypothetical protein
MTSMLTGRVPLRWARREHGAWAEELAGIEDVAALEVAPTSATEEL